MIEWNNNIVFKLCCLLIVVCCCEAVKILDVWATSSVAGGMLCSGHLEAKAQVEIASETYSSSYHLSSKYEKADH